LRRVLDSGHVPRALVVNFSPVLLDADPRVSLGWWSGALNGRDRILMALSWYDTQFAVSLAVHGVIGSFSGRDTIRAALGLESIDQAGIEPRSSADDAKALLRNWSFNRGAQVAPRLFIPVPGSLPHPYQG